MAKKPTVRDSITNPTADALREQRNDADAREAVNRHMRNLADTIRDANIPGVTGVELVEDNGVRPVLPNSKPEPEVDGRDSITSPRSPAVSDTIQSRRPPIKNGRE